MIFQILACNAMVSFALRPMNPTRKSLDRATNWPVFDGDVDILVDTDIIPVTDSQLLRHEKRDFGNFEFGNIFELNKEPTVCETALGPQIGFTCDVCETLASKSSEVKRKMRRKRSQRMKKLHQNVKKHCINILPCCIKLRLYNIIG